jgi:hypothetical protein
MNNRRRDRPCAVACQAELIVGSINACVTLLRRGNFGGVEVAMIVYEVGSIIAVKESNGSRILHVSMRSTLTGTPRRVQLRD